MARISAKASGAAISVAQIRAARGLLGWSQGELADRAGLSRSAVARIELDAVEPHDDTIDRLHRALLRGGVRFTRDVQRGFEGVECAIANRTRR